MALLPPSSNKLLPKRPPTVCPTILPIRVDPVAEIKGTRSSLVINSPTVKSPFIKLKIPSGKLFSLSTCAISFWQAIALNGVFSDGFHTHTSPQTAASILFQLQTATGKLKAEMIPTIPIGCHCSYMR